MRISRRRFLRTGAGAAAALMLPGTLDLLFASIAHGAERETAGYGPLVPDPQGLLDLPAGFTYVALSTAISGAVDDARFSQKLTDGEPVPCLHDGMGAFEGPDGVTILVRNHELRPGDFPRVDEARARPYDPLGAGGTTTLWVDRERRLLRAFPSLSGTFRNCAGGVTPWGSWLTCEECTYMPGPRDATSQDQRSDVEKPHGYAFEVDARAEGLVEPVPLRAMGRFYREAVAVDPKTGFVYQSEDRDDGLLYRFRPRVIVDREKKPKQLGLGDLAKGGVLEALRIIERPSARTQNRVSRDFETGSRFGVDWVTIPDVDPPMDMERDPTDPSPDPLRRRPRTAPGSVRGQGFQLGAAQFARVEGMIVHKGSLYFCATDGGKELAGQVWRLHLGRQELTLMTEPDDRALIDGPDNLTVAPNGDLVVCEDGQGENFVVGITPAGRFYRIARNALNESELAGACFSPDRRTLFVNVQDPGITFAIRGPWSRRK